MDICPMRHFGLIFFYTLLFLPTFLSGQTDTVITGYLQQTTFQQAWAVDWLAQANAYSPDSQTIEKIRSLASDKKISCRVSLGTWCSDSRQHVPAMLKIADLTGIDCEFWGIDRDKKCPWPDCSGWNIEFVPTFEIFSQRRLIGRIVETPSVSLETDILAILMELSK
jgi:hypothetical protein